MRKNQTDKLISQNCIVTFIIFLNFRRIRSSWSRRQRHPVATEAGQISDRTASRTGENILINFYKNEKCYFFKELNC